MAFYNSIVNSSFHIIYNDGEIDDEVALQIIYAMLKNHPIFVTETPALSSDVNFFVKDTINKHLHDFHLIKLPEFELTKLSELLHTLKPTDYSPSKSEKSL